MKNPLIVEDQVSILPVIGKLVKESLPKPELEEETIHFGSNLQQQVFLCWPTQSQGRRRTAVFFLHGGGWSSGHPQLYRFVGNFFACHGYPTILGGYRLAPGYQYPAQLEDIHAALNTGLRELAERNVDIHQVVLGGQSAGAHLAALLAYDHNQPLPENLPGKRFGGFFSISGPLSFAECRQPEMQKMIVDFMGKEMDWDGADPIQRIAGNEDLPALLIHGDRDPLVNLENSLAFARRLSQLRSGPLHVHLARGERHVDLVALFVEDLPATYVLEEWLDRLDSASSKS